MSEQEQEQDHDGSYTWTIDQDDLLNKILNAKNGAQFASDTFEIGVIKWKICIRPNGMNKKNIGSFLVFLKLIKLPESWSNVLICRTIKSPQTKSSVTKMATYGEGESFGWKPNTLLLKDIKQYNLNKLIFKIDIKMLAIRLKENDDLLYHIDLQYDKKQELKWKLDKETVDALKKSNNGKCLSSNIFNGMWVIEAYPNGDDKRDKGKFNINLRLCALPKNVSKFDIQWTVMVKQFNFKRQLKGEYTVTNPGKIVTAGSFEDFKKCTDLEIFIDILIIRGQQIEHLDRYGIAEQKLDFREDTKSSLLTVDRESRHNIDDDREYSPSQSMAVQFQIYENNTNRKIETLKEEFSVKAHEIEEKLMNERQQKQNELHSYQNNIDEELSSCHQQITSLKNELNTKTSQIDKLLNVNEQNQQQIKSLMNINKNKEKEIKIINDKLKQILNEDETKHDGKGNNDKNKNKNKDVMIEINKLKQEIKTLNVEENKNKMIDNNMMRKIRIGFGAVCLIGGVGYILYEFMAKNDNKDSNNSSTSKIKYRTN